MMKVLLNKLIENLEKKTDFVCHNVAVNNKRDVTEMEFLIFN